MTTISTTGIDITKPTSGEATTASVRDNFSAIKDQLDVIANGNLETTQLIVGEPGTEGTGIDVNGTTYDSQLKVSDIGNTHLAEFIIHRHSTTLQPLMIMARANSDTSAHGTVTAGQVVGSWFNVGWTGSHYDIFGESRFSVGTGSVSSTSSPGKWTLLLTPDGSNTPAAVITADSDKSLVFGGTLTATNGGSLTGTWSNLGTVTTVDINGGTADNVTIGATTPAAGTFTTLTATAGTLTGVSTLNIGTPTTTTSGTSHDYTGIPSWAKKITISFSALSSNGTSPPIIQIGDSGGIEATGYSSVGSTHTAAAKDVDAYTTGFGMRANPTVAGLDFHGMATLALLNSTTNTWVFSCVGADINAASSNFGSGSKALSATLDRIRLTTVGGTDTFDAGSFNIIYE